MSIERGPSPEDIANWQAGKEDSRTISDAEHIASGQAKSVIREDGKRTLEFTPETMVNAHKEMTDQMVADLDGEISIGQDIIRTRSEILAKGDMSVQEVAGAAERIAEIARNVEGIISAKEELKSAHKDYIEGMQQDQQAALIEPQAAFVQAKEQFDKLKELLSDKR